MQPKIGLTFASALRAFLRQDPDVIMVGEIRDKETAEIAMHASMTGHLVLSTIHTNDAASAFTRLIQMEIEAFRVRSTIVGILAQRLVRVLCPHCKEAYTGTPYELAQLGIDPARTRRRDERKLSPAISRAAPIAWRTMCRWVGGVTNAHAVPPAGLRRLRQQGLHRPTGYLRSS